jgi:hypothetical protein
MPASTRLRLGFGLGAVLLVAGCTRPTEVAEVEGKVTLGGKLLSGVKVTFYPLTESREQPPWSSGMTDASGVYTLTLQSGQAGAVVGKNRVVVNWPTPERNPDGPQPRPPSPAIPVLYTVAAQSPLTVEVKAGTRQTIDIPLK